MAPAIVCALDPDCSAEWWEYDKIIRHYGSKTWEGTQKLPPGAPPVVKRAWDLAGDAISDPWGTIQCLNPLEGCATKRLEDLLAGNCGGTVRPYEGGGGVRLVENVTGFCLAILDMTGNDAFVVGHTIFGRGTFRGEKGEALLQKELSHVEQYEDWGDIFLPTYFGPASAAAVMWCAATGDLTMKCLHDRNFLERLVGHHH